MDHSDRDRGCGYHRVAVPLSNHSSVELSEGAFNKLYFIGQGIRYVDYVDFQLRHPYNKDILAINHPLTALECEGADQDDLTFILKILEEIQERGERDERTTHRKKDARVASIAVLKDDISSQKAAKSEAGSDIDAFEADYDGDAPSSVRSGSPPIYPNDPYRAPASIQPRVIPRRGAGVQQVTYGRTGLGVAIGMDFDAEKTGAPTHTPSHAWRGPITSGPPLPPNQPWSPAWRPPASTGSCQLPASVGRSRDSDGPLSPPSTRRASPDPYVHPGMPSVNLPWDAERSYRRPQPDFQASASQSSRKRRHRKRNGAKQT